MSAESRDFEHGPAISWATGTAYDFFASLYIIHHPETTGLRKAWAAGVRNRISPAHRDLLAALVPVVAVPVEWLEGLGNDPDSTTALVALDALPDDEVLLQLAGSETRDHARLQHVVHTGTVTDEDVQEFLGEGSTGIFGSKDAEAVRTVLVHFAGGASSGAALKSALREYHERFFAEEESRIGKHTQRALRAAQKLAGEVTTLDLVEELTGGLRLEEATRAKELQFIPSFWAGPLTLFEMIGMDTWVVLFGARPRDVSLIPGDPVPDSLLRSLQAVADPTRLRILRLLREGPRTQVEISRELRLRPPTITHHLKTLRLANLVRLVERVDGEKRYGVRRPRLDEIPGDLLSYITRE